MSKKSKNKDKAEDNSKEAAVVEESEETSGSKAPEENTPLGKALEADEKSATKGKSNSDRHKSTKIIQKKNSAENPRENPEDSAEEEYFPPAERKAHRKRQSTGEALPNSDKVEKTTSERKKKNKDFFIPRFGTEEENPLCLFAPLDEELLKGIASAT